MIRRILTIIILVLNIKLLSMMADETAELVAIICLAISTICWIIKFVIIPIIEKIMKEDEERNQE